ncbi:hypothetical protein B0T10DRAFT_270366 [Thelonectria olida]|uniref:Zn(2)-C6 fungal-type domain-containing protein n=1 Tax=Thelonectria olida TaxID=1576542 RepID=A0A9P8WBL4_9HYPO|nr:hypothetical protein B0T10DRAFT_270366 [Thelonectria olida]
MHLVNLTSLHSRSHSSHSSGVKMTGQNNQAKTPSLPVRQRKAHRKSRNGCGNCKLRSVKCDETKPTCKRCLKSGFVCNYSRAVPALQLTSPAGGSSLLKLSLDTPAPSRPHRGLPPPSPGFRIPLAGPVVGGPMGSYEMTPTDFAALDRFRTRTIFTMGTAKTRHLYSEGAFGLGVTDPYLWHVFLAFALLHDTYLSPSSSTAAHRGSLAFHWYHGTALFHRNLSMASQAAPNALAGTHRDALWASAAILGSAAFAFVGSADPLNAWPLKSPDPTDLDWLKMSDGKRVVWDITDPSRPDSIFHPLMQDHKRHITPNGLAPIPLDALPALFYPLCNLTASNARDNPYHVAASILAQLLPRELDDENVIQFLSFLSQLDPRFRRLLEEKDKPAILLLSYWYAKLVSFKRWWMAQRAWIEGQAICMYMDRECAGDAVIQELLEYPRSMFFDRKYDDGKDTGRITDLVDASMQEKTKGQRPKINWMT